MQVGTRQLHFSRDVSHGGAAEAFFGENLFRRQENFLDVIATNLDLVIAHEGSLTTALPKTSIRSAPRATAANKTSYWRQRMAKLTLLRSCLRGIRDAVQERPDHHCPARFAVRRIFRIRPRPPEKPDP